MILQKGAKRTGSVDVIADIGIAQLSSDAVTEENNTTVVRKVQKQDVLVRALVCMKIAISRSFVADRGSRSENTSAVSTLLARLMSTKR